MSMMGELIKELRAYANVSLYAKEMEVRELLKKAAGTIEGLSAKVTKQNMEKSSQYYNGGWIPVEERLPEIWEDVLVWYEYFRYGDYNCMFQTYGIGFWSGENWGGDVSGVKAKCIAWRPLPPVYEPKED